jgi:hypothetical protein
MALTLFQLVVCERSLALQLLVGPLAMVLGVVQYRKF